MSLYSVINERIFKQSKTHMYEKYSKQAENMFNKKKILDINPNSLGLLFYKYKISYNEFINYIKNSHIGLESLRVYYTGSEDKEDIENYDGGQLDDILKKCKVSVDDKVFYILDHHNSNFTVLCIKNKNIIFADLNNKPKKEIEFYTISELAKLGDKLEKEHS